MHACCRGDNKLGKQTTKTLRLAMTTTRSLAPFPNTFSSPVSASTSKSRKEQSSDTRSPVDARRSKIRCNLLSLRPRSTFCAPAKRRFRSFRGMTFGNRLGRFILNLRPENTSRANDSSHQLKNPRTAITFRAMVAGLYLGFWMIFSTAAATVGHSMNSKPTSASNADKSDL